MSNKLERGTHTVLTKVLHGLYVAGLVQWHGPAGIHEYRDAHDDIICTVIKQPVEQVHRKVAQCKIFDVTHI
jgi:hypothetical protein